MDKPKYKLINKETGEVATYGNDNTQVFGGPWGEVDFITKEPKYIWVENKEE